MDEKEQAEIHSALLNGYLSMVALYSFGPHVGKGLNIHTASAIQDDGVYRIVLTFEMPDTEFLAQSFEGYGATLEGAGQDVAKNLMEWIRSAPYPWPQTLEEIQADYRDRARMTGGLRVGMGSDDQAEDGAPADAEASGSDPA